MQLKLMDMIVPSGVQRMLLVTYEKYILLESFWSAFMILLHIQTRTARVMHGRRI